MFSLKAAEVKANNSKQTGVLHKRNEQG